ncbi:MAG: HIT family protein [Alphaproteobacteria bacterium]|nr:HIT family protein [Alphaproteobacteria bacterium]
MSCVFCAIASGALPATRLHEDDRVIAFLDLHPWRPGQALVVPRAHVQHLADLDPGTRAHLLEVGVALSAALRAAVGAEAVHFLVNDGRAAFQTVPHVHLHLVPRRPGDGARLLARLLTWPLHPLLPARREALDALGAKVRAARG